MKKYYFILYYLDEQGIKWSLSCGDVEAENKQNAMRKIIDDNWDVRLDSASCSPLIYLKER